MHVTNNIDDLLTQVDLTPDSLQGKESESETINNETATDLTSNEDKTESDSAYTDNKSETINKDEPEELTHDDYGQPVKKKEKLYTEAEVQQMMRDRNARGEFARQEAERAKQESPYQEEPSASSDDWEQQFESLVEQTISKREQKIQQQQWQEKAQREQAEFEIKFNSGAAKYSDFESVVVGKPLTPQMVVATKAMADPAAFIYAAAKTQAGELERISKISDPMIQAVEIGKLEERMRKSKAASTGAPRPIEAVKGDVVHNKVKPRSVDDILRAEDAKRMKNRR